MMVFYRQLGLSRKESAEKKSHHDAWQSHASNFIPFQDPDVQRDLGDDGSGVTDRGL
jgi:hypothetical protein